MALLGMGANAPCSGYVPGYHSARDLVFGAEGSTWNSSNGDNELQNNRYNNGSLLGSPPVHLLEYNKELVKQTILKHEAIFRDQIHELHRLYCRQRELMDELKRNELDKRNLRLETSWSSTFPSHASFKNAERIYSSPNLPWSTGQSSARVAESIGLPSGAVQENSMQIYSAPAPAPTPAEGSSKDSKLSASKYKKVGNKLLDLHLPADVYIDCEEDDSLEDERASKLPRVSAYTLEGISQAVYYSDKKPYAANSNGFTDLNEPFKLEEEAAAKSGDLMGTTNQMKNPFHDLSTRTELQCQNLPNNVIWNPYKRQDHVVCSDNLPSEQEKKQEQLSFLTSADQINQGPWSGRKFSGGESSVRTQGPTSAGFVGPSSDPYRLVTEAIMKRSKVSPSVLWKMPASDRGENQTGQALIPSPFNRSSKLIMGMPGLTGNDLYQSRDIKSDPSLDRQNFLLNIVCGSKTLDPQPVITNDLNCFGNQSSSASHELGKYIKGSEDVETSNSINLNVMPANFSDTIGFQSIKEDLLPKGKPSEESKIPTQMESFLLKPCDSGVTHCVELKTTEASDFRKKIHAINVNGEPETSLELDSSQASTSKVYQKVEVTAGESLAKNEPKREHECVAGIIDLNLGMNEDENMPMAIDLQAPVSPENKESSPPRGESDENQIDMPYPLAGQENSESQVEEVRNAAEALVSISAFVGHNDLHITTCPPSESFVNSPLHWFARIASSVTGHPDNDIKADLTGNTDDHEEFLPAGIDYFEAMTLKLTETNVLDCCGKSSDQNEEEGGRGSTSPTQPRKGWINRGRRRKDFQSEILPSLASLSRYEVTEDLQTMGGLMEAAGTHSGRNAPARGRRRSCTSASNSTDSPLKQQKLTSNTELGIEKTGLMSWGKMNKKPRGKRYAARNPKVS